MNISQLPNTITVIRLLLVPVFILSMKYHRYDYALAIFCIAGISDGVDGFLARRFRLESHLGGILDPVADKLLMVSTYVTLTVLGLLPFWLTLLVVSRDFLIIGGFLAYTATGETLKVVPTLSSKINTVVQILLVLGVLSNQVIGLDLGLLVELLVYTVAVTTVVSGAHYYWLWVMKRPA